MGTITIADLLSYIVLLFILGFIAMIIPVCVEEEPREVTVTDYSWQTTMMQALSETTLTEDGKKIQAFIYEDDWITAVLFPQYINYDGKFSCWPEENRCLISLGLSLQNKQKQAIQIIWDETAIVLPNGLTSRVTHGGVRFIEADKSLPNTVVPPNARVADTITATSQLEFSEISGWRVNSLKLSPAGSSIQLYMTIESNDQKKAYTFDFSFTRLESTHIETHNVCVKSESLWQRLFPQQ